MNDDKKGNDAKYANSDISDQAFKRMIIWFAVYVGLFCLGVVFVVNADKLGWGI